MPNSRHARVAVPPTASESAAPMIVIPEREERLRTIRQRLGALLALYLIALQLATAIERATWHWPLRLEAVWSVASVAVAVASLRGAALGYFIAFALRGRRALTVSAACGGVLAAALELVAVVDERPVQPAYLAIVAASAALGAVAFLALARALRARAANDAVILAPDLPLVGGAYVVAPLLWLASTNVAQADGRAIAWGLLLLALYGASLIGSARASRGAAGGGVAAHMVAAGIWSACGLAPLLPTSPAECAAIVGACMVFAALHPLLLGVAARDRRVEGPALRRALPLLVAYLALTVLGPVAASLAGRDGSWPTWAAIAAAAPAWRWGEQVAAFATLGYAAAELRGRRSDHRGSAWMAVAPWIGFAAAVAATLRAVGESPHGIVAIGWRIGGGITASLAAGRLGVGIYELQRRHARAHAQEGFGIRTISSSRARR